MKINKLERAGYMVETPDVLLVFDDTRDQEHHVEKALKANAGIPVVFFVSHNHHHTFNTLIFNTAQNHRRVYVLSNDIVANNIQDNWPIAWMSAGDRIEDPQNIPVKIEAFAGCGKGIGYYVTTPDGTTIFYGGSLGECNDKHSMEVLVQRFATENPEVDLAIVNENVADIFASKVKAKELKTYEVTGN